MHGRLVQLVSMEHYKAKAQPMVRWVKDTVLHKILEWLEKNVRVPLEGTAFDNYVATPLKTRYMGYTQMQRLD